MFRPVLIFISLFATTTLLAQQQNALPGNVDTRPKYKEVQQELRNHFYEEPSHRKPGYKQFERKNQVLEERLNARGEAFNYVKANMDAIAETKSMQMNAQSDWTSIGPFNSTTGMGRVNCMTFIDEDTWLIGTAGGGLWKTNCSGLHFPGVCDNPWIPLTDQLPVLSIGGVTFNPNNPDEIYILTGDGDGSVDSDWRVQAGVMPKVPSIGILKTTDGGNTWSTTSLSFESSDLVGGFKLIRHPSNPLIMFACTTNGLYRTVNGWESYVAIYTSQVVYDIEFHPTDDDIFYISTNTDVIVYDSNTMTQTNTLNFGVADDQLRIAIAITPAEPDYLYISIGNFQTYNSLHLSTDAGASVSQVFDGNCEQDGNILFYYYDDCKEGQAYYDFSLAVHPSIPSVIHVGGVYISESFNGGLDWNTTGSGWPYLGSDVHADVHALEYNPFTQQLIACTDGGVYAFDGNDDEWYPLHYGLTIAQYYHIDLNNVFPGFFLEIMGGAQDNGTQQALLDGSIFDELTGGDGFNCHYGIVDNASFVEYSEIQNGKLMRSGNINGLPATIEITPDEAYIGDAESPNGSWDTPFEMKADNGQILAAGYDKLYISGSGGDTWVDTWNIYTVPNTSYDDKSRIMDIAWGEDFDHLAFTVLEEGDDKYEIWKSNSLFNGILLDDYEFYGWQSWDLDSIAGEGYANLYASDVIFCPQVDENALIVTVSNYVDSIKVFLYDGQGTWSNISFNLPNTPVLTAATDEYGIYVGTDIGVFYKYFNEDLWVLYGEGLPAVPVTDIQVEESIYGKFLFIGTYGRGIWQTEAAAPNRITRWYVDADATGNNSGTSWENAFESFTLAQDVVLEGDSIWVAGGTYFATPSNANNAARSTSFTIDESNVKVFGGFAGWEETVDERIAGVNHTILSGDNGVSSSPGDNSYHVFVTSTSDYTSFDRITFADGNANGSAALNQDFGGGIWLQKGGGSSGKSTVFNQCIFRNNLASAEGGGVNLIDHVTGEIPVRFIDCIFDLNGAAKGGALYILADSEDNQSNADASVLIENCTFINNSSTDLGGGVYVEAAGNGEADLHFENCDFTGNTATQNGGAIYQKIDSQGSMDNHYSNCSFISNTSGDKGGALYTYGSANSNSASGEGYFETRFDTCTFHSNSSSEGGGVYEYEVVSASYAGSPIINRSTYFQCSFDSCNATQYGGSIMLEGAGISPTMILEINECQFTANNATSHGGGVAIFGDNNVTIECSVISSNFSGNNAQYGGAIGYNQSQGTNILTITDCTFTQNTGYNGGAVRTDSGAAVSFECEITNSIFTANHANSGGNASHGGAVSHVGEGNFNAHYTNCQFDNNLSDYRGGAVAIQPHDVTFTECDFSGNFANTTGGVLYIYQGYGAERTTQFFDCNFDNNSSLGNGGVIGAISIQSEILHIDVANCNFVNNQADDGGVIEISANGDEVDIDIFNCIFTANTTVATGNGGVMHLLAAGTLNINSSIFNGNSSTSHGGALDLQCLSDTLFFDIIDCDFLNCEANHAGAIHIENDNSSSNLFGEISQCTFDNNEATLGSGAILMELWDYSEIELIQNAFTNNHSLHASYASGAVQVKSFSTTDTCFVRIFDNTFENNSAVGPAGALQYDSDGHIRSIVSECSFKNNTAGSHGGAIRARANGSDFADIDIYNCLFDNNNSGNRGGAMAFEIGSSNAEMLANINQCVIVNNDALDGGAVHTYSNSAGAISRLDVYNCTISNNTANTKCGGIYAQHGNGSMTGSTANNIIWSNIDGDTENNEKQAFISGGAVISMAHTCIQNGIPPLFLISNSNITDDPLFVNTLDVDGADNTFATADDGFAISSASPCIDIAEEAFSNLYDITNLERPQGPGFDSGAYESLYSTEPTCVGDLNDDGVVNTSDLLLFMSMFGTSCSGCSADITDDGTVNTSDLLLFMSAFGTVCE